MDEAKLRTIAQLQELLDATQVTIFSGTLARQALRAREVESLILRLASAAPQCPRPFANNIHR